MTAAAHADAQPRQSDQIGAVASSGWSIPSAVPMSRLEIEDSPRFSTVYRYVVRPLVLFDNDAHVSTAGWAGCLKDTA
jgi:hypothetical protein